MRTPARRCASSGMGIQVELRVAGKRVQRLPDPAGGFFDAAGDFDRLVSHGNPALGVLGGSIPTAEREILLGTSQMQQLIADVELLLLQAKAGAERRGLVRLRTMAERCAEQDGELVFVGD
jgi:hypothetical protein